MISYLFLLHVSDHLSLTTFSFVSLIREEIFFFFFSSSAFHLFHTLSLRSEDFKLVRLEHIPPLWITLPKSVFQFTYAEV